MSVLDLLVMYAHKLTGDLYSADGVSPVTSWSKYEKEKKGENSATPQKYSELTMYYSKHTD